MCGAHIDCNSMAKNSLKLDIFFYPFDFFLSGIHQKIKHTFLPFSFLSFIPSFLWPMETKSQNLKDSVITQIRFSDVSQKKNIGQLEKKEWNDAEFSERNCD